MLLVFTSQEAKLADELYETVIGADVVYPRPGLPAALAAAALAHLDGTSPNARLFIMQHGAYRSASDDSDSDTTASGGTFKFETRDGWEEFVEILRAQKDAIVTLTPYRLLCKADKGTEMEGPNYYAAGGADDGCSTVDFELLTFRYEKKAPLGSAPKKDNKGKTTYNLRVNVEREEQGWRKSVTLGLTGEERVADVKAMLASQLGVSAERQELRGLLNTCVLPPVVLSLSSSPTTAAFYHHFPSSDSVCPP